MSRKEPFAPTHSSRHGGSLVRRLYTSPIDIVRFQNGNSSGPGVIVVSENGIVRCYAQAQFDSEYLPLSGARLAKVAANHLAWKNRNIGPDGELTKCESDSDGDCTHEKCPQHRDGEPGKSGRSCPIWITPEDC